jgi:enoyl-CoA hydratase/carnithine racemase
MGGQKITADEALDFGLVERLVVPEKLITYANELCRDAIDASPQLSQEIKAMCR